MVRSVFNRAEIDAKNPCEEAKELLDTITVDGKVKSMDFLIAMFADNGLVKKGEWILWWVEELWSAEEKALLTQQVTVAVVDKNNPYKDRFEDHKADGKVEKMLEFALRAHVNSKNKDYSWLANIIKNSIVGG